MTPTLTTLLESLLSAIRELARDLGLDEVDAFSSVRSALERARVDRQQFDKLTGLVSSKQSHLELLKLEVENSEQSVRESAERVSTLSQKLKLLEDQISELVLEIGTVAEDERKKIQNRIDTLRNQRNKAVERAGKARAAVDSARAVVANQMRVADARERELETCESKCREALERAGFSDALEVEQSRLDGDAKRRLDEVVLRHDRELHSMKQGLETARAKLGDSRVTEPEVLDAESRLNGARSRREQALNASAVAEHAIERLETDIRRVQELSGEKDGLSRISRLYKALGEDLSSNRIPEYVLTETFRELVRGASDRLLKMSRRYGLEYDPRSRFSVIDYDQADARRSTDTLSGGEIFLASLALATELSAQIQNQAGAVLLESLFIDEGFGALDSESLELVAEAIETLPTAGRVVCIVTHVPELAARLPARLEVEKSKSGSTVRISEN